MSEPTAEEHRNPIDKLFEIMVRQRASDLHLKFGQPPILRIGGQLQALKSEPLNDRQIQKLTYPMLTQAQIAIFEQQGSVDFGYEFGDHRRVRVNLYRQRGHISMSARLVQAEIPSFAELHLPPVLENIASLHQGLVLVCGPTGCGKSTTLAAMVEYINTHRRCHILTIEDPIEFSFTDKKSFIDQRELGLDVPSWEAALKYTVRQDPDVILVGEMRDSATFSAGLAFAETGHLVLGTMHSSNASQTISRILDIFPPENHTMVREQLAANLRAIICQMLLPSCKEGLKMVPAVEVMLVNPTIRSLIIRGEEKKIIDVIRACRTEGMQDLTQSIAELVQKDFVLRRDALEYAPNREQLEMALRGIAVDVGRILG